MPLEINTLRYFLTIVEEGSISRAADKLFLSQPSLSQQIHRMEKELGAELFQREARGVTLTPAGRIFEQYARQTVESTANMKAEISFLHEEIAGEAKISAEVLSIPLAKIYCAFHRIHPHAVANFVHMGSLPAPDIVVTTNSLDKLLWSGRELLREELLIALPIDHPLATQSSISIDQLRDESFIFSENREVDRLVTRYCAAAGFSPKIAMMCYTMHMVTALVSEGVGIAVLPAYWQAYKPDTVALLPVRGVDFFRTVYLYHQRGTQRNLVAEALENFIVEQIHAMYLS